MQHRTQVFSALKAPKEPVVVAVAPPELIAMLNRGGTDDRDAGNQNSRGERQTHQELERLRADP